MKNKIREAKVEVIEFICEDIIATSTPWGDEESTPGNVIPSPGTGGGTGTEILPFGLK